MSKKAIRIICLILAAVLILGIIPVVALSASINDRIIYFTNSDGWNNVNIYYWCDNNTGMISWPGQAMTLVEGNIYSFRLPQEVQYVIFTDANGIQTPDLTLPADQNMYTFATGEWSTYVDETACAHQWDEGVKVSDPTCTAPGYIRYTCTLCGDVLSDEIPATGHQVSGGVCTVCGASTNMVYFRNTDDWSRVYVYFWSDSSTELTLWPGEKMDLLLDDIYGYDLPLSAQYVIFNNGDGQQTGDLTLKGPGFLYSDGAWSPYDTCDHSYDDGVPTTPATCTEDGVLTYTCTKCGDTKTETIPATGHTIVDGKCSVCGLLESCTEHSWDDGEVIQEATCWLSGSVLYTCTLCGETKTETIPGGHKLYVAEIIPATCTTTGKEITKCPNCAYKYDRTLPRIDHSYTVAGETIPATCTTDGYTVYTCATCDKTQPGDLVYHTGHDFQGGSTCVTCGHTCSHNYQYDDPICFNCGDGGPDYVEGWYQLETAGDLNYFAYLVDMGNVSINGKLMNDIDLKGDIWFSIGYYASDALDPETMAYSGTFDGQGHVVSNFTTYGTDNEGLFGYCSSATIRNVGVVGANVTGWRAGAVVGYALTSKVEGCFAINCTITAYTENSVALESGTIYIAPVAGPQGGTTQDCFAIDCTLLTNTDLVVETAPVGGLICNNGYFCNIAGPLPNINATEVTPDQVRSGELTYLLNQGVTDGTQRFYQTCGEGRPAHSGLTVYQITGADGTVRYANSLTPSITVPTLTLDHPSLSFEGEIMYNLYFAADDLTDVVEMGLLAFNTKLESGTIENADNIYPGYITAGSLYMSQTAGVPARYLGDAVYFKAYAKLSDGSYVYSGMAGYNAAVYAKSILKNSTNDYMKRLVVAMINYGAEAQGYFCTKEGAEYTPMNDFLTAEQQAMISAYDASMVADLIAVDSNKVGMFTYNTGDFAKRTNSVSFDGAFAINYYFTAKGTPDNGMKFYYWNTADYLAADVLTPENATGSMDMVAGSGNQYWGQVSGIAAKEVDQTYFVAGVYELDGVTYTTGILAYSLGKYCAKLAAGTTEQQALSAATAVYGYYAKEYFANVT